MRGTPSCLLVILALLLGIAGFGCNGGTTSASANPTASITVSLQPSGPQAINEGQTVTFVATVTNDASNKGVSWTLNGVGSLSNKTATSVDYLAPATVSSSSTATVTATSIANADVTAGVTITVSPTPALSVSTTLLPSGSVGLPYSNRLQAFGGVSPYTWSVSSGSLPSWASLDSSAGIISGTPDATGTSVFTIKVSDSQSTPASATQSLSIAVAGHDSTNNAELNGQYAFLLQGFDDATGNQFAIVGSFKADGNGNVSGLEDINGPAGYQSVTFTGTYTVGADNRGQATLVNSLKASTNFAIAVGSLNSKNVATRASLIEFDDTTGVNGKRGSGFVYLQDPSTFNLSSINGPYAVQFVGQTGESETRLALTGAYTADGNGNVKNGQVDSNVDGLMASSSPQTFTATISTSPGTETSSFGRVTTTPAGIPFHFVYYIVSAKRALAMSTDQEYAAGLLGGQVLAQASTSFSATSLSGTAVGYGVGQSTESVGLWTFDGSAKADFNLMHSDDQWLYSGGETGTLNYSVAPNGRVTTSGGSFAPGVPGAPIFYLVDTNKGFLMSTDSSVSTGFLEPQTGGPFSDASLSGAYFIGTVSPAVTSAAVATGVGTSAGDGALNLTLDESSPVRLLVFDRSWTEQLTFDSAGRGSGDFFVTSAFVFLISNTKAVVMLNTLGWPMITIFQR